MQPEPRPEPGERDAEAERLSEDLKAQVARAKARISERYGKLIETRSFDASKTDKAD